MGKKLEFTAFKQILSIYGVFKTYPSHYIDSHNQSNILSIKYKVKNQTNPYDHYRFPSKSFGCSYS